jgi:hypothetical protein
MPSHHEQTASFAMVPPSPGPCGTSGQGPDAEGLKLAIFTEASRDGAESPHDGGLQGASPGARWS